MSLAQIGPLTSVAESAAAAVGACMLLGSFVFGAQGSLRGLRMGDLERRALFGGYAGGFFGVGFVVADTMIRYAF